MRPIKFFQSDYAELKPEIDAAIQGVLNSGEFIHGEQCKKLEQGICDFLKVDHCVTVGNGTDALMIAMMALGLPKGSEVIMPAFNYVAAAEACAVLGLVPVFCDVDPATYCIDYEDCRSMVTERTSAIIVVHLFGYGVNIEPFMQMMELSENLFIIEDFAQSFGTPGVGQEGHIGITSFFPTKNLGCFGDGGAIVTSTRSLADRVRKIANHGQRTKYHHEIVGVNSRLDEIQAAILNVKLQYLPADLDCRNQIATFYNDNIYFKYNKPPLIDGRTWNQYTLLLDDKVSRPELQAYLLDFGIPTRVYYEKVTYWQPPYIQTCSFNDCSISDYLSKHVLSLPIHPSMDQQQIEYIVKRLNEYKR